MFHVYSQRHKSWGEPYVQSLFWLVSFEVFWFTKMQQYRQIKNWTCSLCISLTTPPTPQPLPSPTPTKASDGNLFTILQFNANGIGYKQVKPAGGLLTLIHKSINFSRRSELSENIRSSFGRVDYYGQQCACACLVHTGAAYSATV